MIVTAGEMLVEFVSHQVGCGLQQIANYSGPYPSGAPAIFIDQAAKVGADTKIYGSVGQDPFGRAQIDRLRLDGVDISAVQQIKDKTTGVAFVSYFEDGSRVFVFTISGSAAEIVSTDDMPTTPFTLHVSGASLGMPTARQALRALVEQAKALGGKVSCDPNVRPELMKDASARDALLDIVSKSDILLPSDADVRFLYPDLSDDECLDKMLSGTAEVVVLKNGSRGVRVKSATEDFHLPAHKVEEVDPTGAGDCFCGAFVGMLDQGSDLRTAATYANAAGAMHVTTRGPMEINPGLSEIEKFLSKENVDGHSAAT